MTQRQFLLQIPGYKFLAWLSWGTFPRSVTPEYAVTKRELDLTTNTEVQKRNVKAPESLDNYNILWFSTSQQLHSV